MRVLKSIIGFFKNWEGAYKELRNHGHKDLPEPEFAAERTINTEATSFFFSNQHPSPPACPDFFTHSMTEDLANVGEKKALGYMQFAEIRKAGFDEFRISVLLRKKGLKIFVIPNPTPEELYAYNPEIDKFVHMEDNRKYDVVPKGHFRGIQSGALVAYDEEAVASFLQDNIAIIEDENGEEPVEEYKWPMNPADFIDMVFRKNAKSKGMNILIHKIFQEMPERNRLYNLS